MKLVQVDPEILNLSAELVRFSRAKTFEERLRSSIDEIGLAEPLKIALDPSGDYIVIDGALRLRAVKSIRLDDPSRFQVVDAYLVDYSLRYEIRYQSDIYQDLLPSQLATLVEHLHKAENVMKSDIARYIGVSPATLRNYTGLWRLLERGGPFARIVGLMDMGVFPASNPYAWLRLTDEGLEFVLREHFAKGEDLEKWFDAVIRVARVEGNNRYPLTYVEMVTAALPARFYRVTEDVRSVKRELGLRRAGQSRGRGLFSARDHLIRVSEESEEPVLAAAASALHKYLS